MNRQADEMEIVVKHFMSLNPRVVNAKFQKRIISTFLNMHKDDLIIIEKKERISIFQSIT